MYVLLLQVLQAHRGVETAEASCSNFGKTHRVDDRRNGNVSVYSGEDLGIDWSCPRADRHGAGQLYTEECGVG